MIWISFGKWSNAAGALFVRERIYWRGWNWTPFCWVSWRYRKVHWLKMSNLELQRLTLAKANGPQELQRESILEEHGASCTCGACTQGRYDRSLDEKAKEKDA